VEAHVSDVTQTLNPGRDVRTDLELVSHGAMGKRGGKRRCAVEKVETLATDGDQGGRVQVSNR
jgi:hypothetical protein